MENTARLYRSVIDEVLHRTQEDILLGQDEHVATRIVHDLQTLWQAKLAAVQTAAADAALAKPTPMPGQNDPAYQDCGSHTTAAATAALNPYEAHPEPLPQQQQTAVEAAVALVAASAVDTTATVATVTAKRPAPSEAAAASASKKVKVEASAASSKDGGSGSADDSDGSSLGTDSDGESDEETEMETDNLVLCQFVNRVKHHKSKWKCQLRDGVMHLNGRDYIFHECSGDFRW